MKYHALFVIFEKKKQQIIFFSPAANCRWHFMGKADAIEHLG